METRRCSILREQPSARRGHVVCTGPCLGRCLLPLSRDTTAQPDLLKPFGRRRAGAVVIDRTGPRRESPRHRLGLRLAAELRGKKVAQEIQLLMDTPGRPSRRARRGRRPSWSNRSPPPRAIQESAAASSSAPRDWANRSAHLTVICWGSRGSEL